MNKNLNRKLGIKRSGATGGVLDNMLGRIMSLIGVSVLLVMAASFFSEEELDTKVGEPGKHIANGLKKYKTDYFDSNSTYDKLTEETSQTFMRPLMFESTSEYLFPQGDMDIKFFVGNHGAAGYESQYAYACMDATDKGWSNEENLAAENKFASKIKAFFRSPNIVVDGDQTAEYASASAAQSATAGAPDEDGFICLTKLN